MNGALDFLDTKFFDEIFQKNTDGTRSLVAKMEIDTKSIIFLALGISIAGIIIKKL
jgi:hypothetical protein